MIDITETERAEYERAARTLEEFRKTFLRTSAISRRDACDLGRARDVMQRALEHAGVLAGEELRCSKCSCTELEHEVRYE